jgi:hypothetical protein
MAAVVGEEEVAWYGPALPKKMKNLSSSPERITGTTFTGTIFQGV